MKKKLNKKETKRLQETARKFYAKGYGDAGASFTKRALKGFIAQSGAPSEDIDTNNKTLRQRSRMLYMSTPVASGAINTNRTKVVGSGLHVKSSINNDVLGISEEEANRWQKNTEAEWRLWAENKKNCDMLGLNNFYQLQQVALKSWLSSGDVFVLIKRCEATTLQPYTMRLQLIEADRVSTPYKFSKTITPNITEGVNSANKNKIYDGVEVDSAGKVVAYHICDVYPGQMTAESVNWQRVLAVGEKTGIPNVLHIMEAERPDQHRGVPFLAPDIETLLQLRRYTESELMAALVQTYLTAWITTETDPTEFPFNEVGSGDIGIDELDEKQDDTDNLSNSDNEYEIGPGTINHLAPGEKVTLGNPNVPTAGFENFVKTIIKMIGSSLELPYDVLIKEFNSSYSAAKGALEEAWEVFKMRRSWFIADFCQPVYESWLAEAVAIGRIKAPGFFNDPVIRKAWCGARWDGPAQTHLDPVKEAKAAEMEVAHGWKTNEQVSREFYGSNWNENMQILKNENKTSKHVNTEGDIYAE